MLHTTEPVLYIIMGLGLVIAAICDLWSQRIPNLLTYPLMAAALLAHVMTQGVGGLAFGAQGLGLGIALFLLPYFMGGMGAGDVKLMGAAGAALGPRGVFIAALFTAIAGGIYAMVLLLVNRRYAGGMIARSATTLKTFALTGQFIPIPAPEKGDKHRLCYAVPIALGTFLYMFLTWSGQLWIY